MDAADKLLWTNSLNLAPTAGQPLPYTLFTYDAFGQMVRRDRKDSLTGTRHTLDFQWDGDGRLRDVWEGTGSLFTAGYSGDGERLTKADAITGSHVYSYGLYDTNGDTYHTPGLVQRKNGVHRFYHEDQLGSTRYLSDATGLNTPAALRYDAFGVSVHGGNANAPNIRILNR